MKFLAIMFLFFYTWHWFFAWSRDAIMIGACSFAFGLAGLIMSIVVLT